jgi:hypothetical protein
MNCADFESLLQQQMDRDLILNDEPFRAHFEGCPSCRAAWDQARLLADAIGAWRDQVPDVDLVDAVIAAHALSSADLSRAELSHENLAPTTLSDRPTAPPCSAPASAPRGASARTPARQPRYFLAASLVAVLAGAACLVLNNPLRHSEPEGSIANRTPVGEPSTKAVAFGENEVALVNQATAAYDSLAQSAAGALEEFASIVIPARDAAPVAPRKPEENERWIDGLQDQLRPIGESLGDAFDFLWEAGQAPENSRT